MHVRRCASTGDLCVYVCVCVCVCVENVLDKKLCTMTLKPKQIELLVDATEDEYYFEMFLDELPVWGWLGEVEAEDMLLGHITSPRHYIYTHLDFLVGYNGEQIVSVNTTTPQKQRRDITVEPGDSLDVTFTYSVTCTSLLPSGPTVVSDCVVHSSAVQLSCSALVWTRQLVYKC